MPLAWPLQCRCHPGFHLKQDGKTCVDVDECTTTYPCAQHCINTHGSFHCLCVDGFVPRPDDLTSCKSTSGEHSPLVLLCSRLLFLRVKRIQYRMSYKNALLAKMFEVVEKILFQSLLYYRSVLLTFQMRSLSLSLRTATICENSTWMDLTTHWLNR